MWYLITIIKKITIINRKKYFHDNLLWKITEIYLLEDLVACFLLRRSWDARSRAIQRFYYQALSGCEGKIGTSEIGPKCATNFEHIEIHVYNFYNFIKNIFGVIMFINIVIY